MYVGNPAISGQSEQVAGTRKVMCLKIHWISNYVVHSLVSRFVLGSVRSACEHLQKWQAVNNQASAQLTVTDPPLVARNLLRLCPTGPEFRKGHMASAFRLSLNFIRTSNFKHDLLYSKFIQDSRDGSTAFSATWLALPEKLFMTT